MEDFEDYPEGTRRLKPLWVILAAAAAMAGAYLLFQSGRQGKGREVEQPFFTVREGPLTISVTESGTIKAREQIIIKNEVEGRTTLLYLVPEGTPVKKGDLLVELDSSNLEDQKVDQLIKVENAEAAYIRAREDLEVVRNQAQSNIDKAELAYKFAQQDLVKYQEGVFPQEVRKAEAKITLAQEELQRAEEKLQWSLVLFDEKYLSQTELQADELASKKAGLELELAMADMELLKNFTYEREMAQLESDVKQNAMALERTQRKSAADVVQAEANLRARSSEFDRQKSKLQKIEEQISRARIYAPADGLVVHATSTRATWRGNAEPLDEGQEVRERQELIHLPITSSFLAQVKVHESSLDKITEDQPVRLTVDALPGSSFTGKMAKIAPLPDAQSIFMNPDLKVYQTEIHIDGEDLDLRTGMSCRAEIIIADYKSAVYVPVQAVLKVGGIPTVYLKEGDRLVPRTVELGLDNNIMVRVLRGLKPGDEVLLTPPLEEAGMESFMEGEKEESAETEVKPAAPDRQDLRNLNPDQREEMRKKWEQMSPEERASLRERYGQGKGPGRPAEGQPGQSENDQ
jgi:HlyD family secretion protein